MRLPAKKLHWSTSGSASGHKGGGHPCTRVPTFVYSKQAIWLYTAAWSALSHLRFSNLVLLGVITCVFF